MFLVFAVAAIVIRREWFHVLNAWLALLLFSADIAAEFLKLR